LHACSSYESFNAAEAADNGTTAAQRVLPPLAWLSALMSTVQTLAGQGVTPLMLAQLASAAQPGPANTSGFTDRERAQTKSLPATDGETFAVSEEVRCCTTAAAPAWTRAHATSLMPLSLLCCAPSGLLGSCTAERCHRARQAF
jgi:hypothetical protein